METLSQSPLVGAFVPAYKAGWIPKAKPVSRNPLWSGHSFRHKSQAKKIKEDKMSQSPLVGAFVPATTAYSLLAYLFKSQSPLVGAFVPALTLKSVVISEYFAAGCEHVGKNGVRVGRPGRPTDHGRK